MLLFVVSHLTRPTVLYDTSRPPMAGFEKAWLAKLPTEVRKNLPRDFQLPAPFREFASEEDLTPEEMQALVDMDDLISSGKGIDFEELHPELKKYLPDMMMPKKPSTPTLTMEYIQSAANIAQLERAIENLEFDKDSCKAVMIKFREFGRPDKCFRVFHDYKLKADKPMSELTLDDDMYNIAFAACQEGGQIEWAMHITNEMVNLRIPPDATAYNALIASLEQDKMPYWDEDDDDPDFAKQVNKYYKEFVTTRAQALRDEMAKAGLVTTPKKSS